MRRVLAAILFAAIPFVAVHSLSQEVQPQALQIQQHPESGSQPQPNNEEGTEYWPQIDGYRLKVSDTLLVAVTFLLFIATLALWWSTRRLVKGAELIAERQLRAYVFLTGIDFIEQDKKQDRFIHKFEIKNTGLTPAYKLWIESLTRPLPHPLPADFSFAIDPPGRNPSVMMLGPGQTTGHDSHADEPLSKTELIKIRSLETGTRLYTFGTIRYEDAFGRKKFTNFCYFVEWTAGTERYSISVHPSERHNDAN